MQYQRQRDQLAPINTNMRINCWEENTCEQLLKILRLQVIHIINYNFTLLEYDPRTPVKEMKSKLRNSSNKKSATPLTKSILNKKNSFLNESSAKKKSGKKKSIAEIIKKNTRANSKMTKLET